MRSTTSKTTAGARLRRANFCAPAGEAFQLASNETQADHLESPSPRTGCLAGRDVSENRVDGVRPGMSPLGGGFPGTRVSVLFAVRDADPSVRQIAWDTLVEIYWKPVYSYLRLHWHRPPDEAEDLTQEFFTRAYDRGFFDRFDPEVARFLTFLRVCIDRLVQNEQQSATRMRRGGDQSLISMDAGELERAIAERVPDTSIDADQMFEMEWTRSIFSAAVERLRKQLDSAGKARYFEIFRQYDLFNAPIGNRPTYDEIAANLGLLRSDVANYLAYARRSFQTHVVACLREATGSEAEFVNEARRLGTVLSGASGKSAVFFPCD